ncbi:MAG: hypothetical protein GDA43_12215 [Hormoscilla sp. SP5CHS1]|nr:hypothetical protein [Hormoscilla sp. SP5CHS1]
MKRALAGIVPRAKIARVRASVRAVFGGDRSIEVQKGISFLHGSRPQQHRVRMAAIPCGIRPSL